MQSSTSNTTFLERLAVARLQHTVDELQTQVDHDRTLICPTRKVIYCVCDHTALTASIPELKRFVSAGSIIMIVPFETLDALDTLKKGTENTNIHARESIRFFDRAQTAAGRQQITGVRIQGPTEKFVSWEECLAACAGTPAASDPELQHPPSYIKELLNCAVYHLNRFVVKGVVEQQKVLVVTNNELLRDWAELYGVPTIGSGDVAALVKREETEYMEKKRHYDHAIGNPRSPASPGSGRGGRGGGGFGSYRGGRGGGGSARRDSWNANEPRSPISPNGFGGGGRGRSPRDSNPPDFILRGPPRGVARGRGKLWEP